MQTKTQVTACQWFEDSLKNMGTYIHGRKSQTTVSCKGQTAFDRQWHLVACVRAHARVRSDVTVFLYWFGSFLETEITFSKL